MKVKVKSRKKSGLVESWSSVQGSRIDLEKGIVKNVKIIGPESKHGRSYSWDAMKAAVPMYEGIRVNIDHPTKVDADRKSRSYADRFGRLHNVRFVEGKGVFGDLHYNKKHRLAEQFEYDVENDPKNLGLSHNAYGDTVRRGDRSVVESITSVQSVDLVADPATNDSLFESQSTVKPRVRVRRQAKWEKLMESLGMELGDAPTPREAIAKLLEAIMLDGSLTPEQRREKILKCLEMDVADTGSGSNRVEESEDMTKKPEVKAKPDKATQKALREAEKLRNELDARNRRDRVRRLCESMSFKPSKTQLKAIAAVATKKEAKELIEGFMGPVKAKKKNETSNPPKSRAGGEGRAKKLTEAETEAWLEGLME